MNCVSVCWSRSQFEWIGKMQALRLTLHTGNMNMDEKMKGSITMFCYKVVESNHSWWSTFRLLVRSLLMAIGWCTNIHKFTARLWINANVAFFLSTNLLKEENYYSKWCVFRVYVWKPQIIWLRKTAPPKPENRRWIGRANAIAKNQSEKRNSWMLV